MTFSRLPFVPVLAFALAATSYAPVTAADLQPKTTAAFERYTRATEAQHAKGEPFLWTDGLGAAARASTLERLARGELVIERLTTTEAGKSIDVPDGLIHHWLGVVLVPGTTVDRAVALLQDYDRHATIYAPNVAGSKLLARDGDDFRVFLRFSMTKVITVVVNSEHAARFTRPAADRAASRIVSTRISEVADPGTPKERELPSGKDGGYLWRLNSYWRFVQRPEGVYVQCESITLTRGIPFGLGWLVGPFVTSIPRETLAFTLETTRKALLKQGDARPAN